MIFQRGVRKFIPASRFFWLFHSNVPLNSQIINLMSATYIVQTENSSYTFTSEDLEKHHIVWMNDNKAGINFGNKSAFCKIESIDPATRTVHLNFKGRKIKASILEPIDQQLKAMGYAASATRVLREIKAPMPGLVLEVNVKEGDRCSTGDKLLVLEAMKMENVITLPGDAVIKKVLVKKGDAVDKNQPLIELDNV